MLAINYGKFDILSNHTIPYHIISQHITTSHILTLTSYPSFGKAKLSIFWESAYQFKHRVYYIHSTTNRTFVLEVQIQPYEHMVRISERQSDRNDQDYREHTPCLNWYSRRSADPRLASSVMASIPALTNLFNVRMCGWSRIGCPGRTRYTWYSVRRCEYRKKINKSTPCAATDVEKC